MDDSGARVFLSHSRRDGQRDAAWLDGALVAAGCRPWRDTRSIELTTDFTTQLEHAILDSDVVVVCVTPDIRRADSYVRREVVFALAVKKPIVVVRFTDTVPPISLVTHTYIDFFPDRASGLADLLGVLGRSLSRPGIPQNEARSAYLSGLYREIVARLDLLTVLPATGAKVPLLDIEGDLDRAESGFLPRGRFHPPVSRVGVGAREAMRSCPRLAVVGGPGSGKTTTLMALARDLAVEARLDHTAALPVLLSADAWAAGVSLIDWVRAEIPSLPVEEPVVLLVDGLDEVPHTEKVDGAARHSRGALVEALSGCENLVVTGRPEAFTSGVAVHGTLRLTELTDRQIETFTAAFPEVTKLVHTDSQAASLARTPLMLTLLCSTSGITGSDISSPDTGEIRDRVIESFVKHQYRREAAQEYAHRGYDNHLFDALGELAMLDTGGGGNRNYFDDRRLHLVLGADGLELALRMQVLVRRGTSGARFYHLAIRDYFGFRYAIKALQHCDPAMRDQAAWALWQVPDRRAVPALLQTLADPDEYVRGSAAAALGAIGDPHAATNLRSLLDDHTAVSSMYGNTVAMVARWALARLANTEASELPPI